MGHNEVWVRAAREGAVLLPARRHGILRFGGADRLEFLHGYTTQDVKRLAPGQGCTSAVSNWRGTVTDLVRVLVRPGEVLLLCTPGRQGVVKQALERFLIRVDVSIEDITGDVAVLELGGPRILKTFPAAADLALDAHRTVQLAPPVCDLPEDANPLAQPDGEGPEDAPVEAGTSVVVIRTRGFHGGGVAILLPASAQGALRERLRRMGATAIGEEAWELVRLEEGIPEFGRDIGEETNVWEARLDSSVSLEKGCYLGQEIVARLHNYRKVQRYLMGVHLAALVPVSPGERVVGPGGDEIGKITSAAPDFAGGVRALALVHARSAVAGARIHVAGMPGELEDLPYWSKQPV